MRSTHVWTISNLRVRCTILQQITRRHTVPVLNTSAKLPAQVDLLHWQRVEARSKILCSSLSQIKCTHPCTHTRSIFLTLQFNTCLRKASQAAATWMSTISSARSCGICKITCTSEEWRDHFNGKEHKVGALVRMVYAQSGLWVCVSCPHTQRYKKQYSIMPNKTPCTLARCIAPGCPCGST